MYLKHSTYYASSLNDRPPAHHRISIIHHHRLTRRDGPLRGIEENLQLVLSRLLDGAGGELLGIPGAAHEALQLIQIVAGEKVDLVGPDTGGKEISVGTQRHGVGLGVFSHHIGPLAQGDI